MTLNKANIMMNERSPFKYLFIYLSIKCKSTTSQLRLEKVRTMHKKKETKIMCMSPHMSWTNKHRVMQNGLNQIQPVSQSDTWLGKTPATQRRKAFIGIGMLDIPSSLSPVWVIAVDMVSYLGRNIDPRCGHLLGWLRCNRTRRLWGLVVNRLVWWNSVLS